MAKKRKIDQILRRPWCWFCERDFEDEKVLILHQKAKHFKCPTCHRKLNTAQGMFVHMAQVHKETITKVPNAIKGRDRGDVEVFGMEGIPLDDFLSHYKDSPDVVEQIKRHIEESSSLLLSGGSNSNLNPTMSPPVSDSITLTSMLSSNSSPLLSSSALPSNVLPQPMAPVSSLLPQFQIAPMLPPPMLPSFYGQIHLGSMPPLLFPPPPPPPPFLIPGQGAMISTSTSPRPAPMQMPAVQMGSAISPSLADMYLVNAPSSSFVGGMSPILPPTIPIPNSSTSQNRIPDGFQAANTATSPTHVKSFTIPSPEIMNAVSSIDVQELSEKGTSIDSSLLTCNLKKPSTMARASFILYDSVLNESVEERRAKLSNYSNTNKV